jgi:hypothetical protein
MMGMKIYGLETRSSDCTGECVVSDIGEYAAALFVRFEFEPEQVESWDCPGHSLSVEITEVGPLSVEQGLGAVDILPLMDDDTVVDIQAELETIMEA